MSTFFALILMECSYVKLGFLVNLSILYRVLINVLNCFMFCYFGRCAICYVQLKYILRRFFWIMINCVPNVGLQSVALKTMYVRLILLRKLCNWIDLKIWSKSLNTLDKLFDRVFFSCTSYSTLHMWTGKHFILEKFKKTILGGKYAHFGRLNMLANTIVRTVLLHFWRFFS